jgi:hypothetical protein
MRLFDGQHRLEQLELIGVGISVVEGQRRQGAIGAGHGTEHRSHGLGAGLGLGLLVLLGVPKIRRRQRRQAILVGDRGPAEHDLVLLLHLRPPHDVFQLVLVFWNRFVDFPNQKL